MSTDLVPKEEMGLSLSRENIELLKRTVCKGATDDEFKLFLHVCRRTGLDPMAKQIHAIRRREKVGNDWKETMSFQTGIDGYRLIADRTGLYRGQTAPEWCDAKGQWADMWLDPENPPHAARVAVYRDGFEGPLYGVAIYRAYVQRKNDGEPMARWKTDPAGMLAKCAEALALRKSFPQELSGVRTDEEMGQAEQAPETPTIQMPKPVESKVVSEPPPEEARDPEQKDVETTIVKVEVQNGKNATGGPWTLYRVKCANDVQYTTFEKHLGEAAQAVAGTGEIVSIGYKHTPKGERLLMIAMPGEPGAA